MRAIIQRVSKASVSIDDTIKGSIEKGYLILLGIESADDASDINWLVRKIIGLRIFSDEAGKMNLSIKQIAGNVLVVSQFTLFASCKKGNRPSFLKSALPKIALPLYQQFIKTISEQLQKEIATGEFGADMQIELINDGPVTILLDSKNPE